MSRYIDADKMIADLLTVDPQYETMIRWCCDVTNAQPTADVVEVVRCKDCMWGNNKTRSGKRYCELSDMYQVDDGFCNWGEKIK